MSLANAYVSMRSPREFRAALGELSALKEILRESGGQFDPAVVSAFFELVASRSLAELLATTGALPVPSGGDA